MNEILEGKGLVRIAEDKVYVTALKGPLEEDWEKKVEAFVLQILVGVGSSVRPLDSAISLEESR